MKPNNFAKYLTEFFSDYLTRQKNVSRNTVFSYRDTFKLLIRYCKEVKNIKAEKITLDIWNFTRCVRTLFLFFSKNGSQLSDDGDCNHG